MPRDNKRINTILWDGAGYISRYCCNTCDFHMPTGWGFHTYVRDDNDNRVPLFHPAEFGTVKDVLGNNFDEETFNDRFGREQDTACTACLHVFELDVDRDPRTCPSCGSGEVRTTRELVNERCPACKQGTIEERPTGMVS